MATDAPGTRPVIPRAAPPSRTQALWDVALAGTLLLLVLAFNLSGIESGVAANRDHDALSVSLTAVAVGALALRRRYPMSVLVATLLAILVLIAIKGTVGLATLGPFVAFYTAVALGSRRRARAALGVLLAAIAVTGLLRPVDLSREGAVVSLLVFAGAFVLATSTRARRETSAADVAAAVQRAGLAAERAEVEHERAAGAATQERLRITRELHDVIGHAMSVMVVQAGVAERLLDSNPHQARRSVEEIARTGRRSLTEMRHILGTLRVGDGDDARGPTPTLADVEALAARVQVAGLPVEVTLVGQRPVIPPGVDLAAYRVVQESLTNCLRHSAASSATVVVTYHPTAVETEIVDDGQQVTPALDPDAPAPTARPTGHGLAGMRERVAIYGGELSVGARDDGGFRVHARFPLTVPTDQASP